MTKQEAYNEMLLGFKMRHSYYSPEEFVFINSNGEFETEDGYTHGGVNDEFWSTYQHWEDGWENYSKEIEDIFKLTSDDPYMYAMRTHLPKLMEFNNPSTQKQRIEAERTELVKPRSLINRNDLCTCGSGIKYKKCCLNN